MNNRPKRANLERVLRMLRSWKGIKTSAYWRLEDERLRLERELPPSSVAASKRAALRPLSWRKSQ